MMNQPDKVNFICIFHEIYQVSQKNVPLGEVCPSPKGTFFWDTLYNPMNPEEKVKKKH